MWNWNTARYNYFRAKKKKKKNPPPAQTDDGDILQNAVKKRSLSKKKKKKKKKSTPRGRPEEREQKFLISFLPLKGIAFNNERNDHLIKRRSL